MLLDKLNIKRKTIKINGLHLTDKRSARKTKFKVLNKIEINKKNKKNITNKKKKEIKPKKEAVNKEIRSLLNKLQKLQRVTISKNNVRNRLSKGGTNYDRKKKYKEGRKRRGSMSPRSPKPKWVKYLLILRRFAIQLIGMNNRATALMGEGRDQLNAIQALTKEWRELTTIPTNEQTSEDLARSLDLAERIGILREQYLRHMDSIKQVKKRKQRGTSTLNTNTHHQILDSQEDDMIMADMTTRAPDSASSSRKRKERTEGDGSITEPDPKKTDQGEGFIGQEVVQFLIELSPIGIRAHGGIEGLMVKLAMSGVEGVPNPVFKLRKNAPEHNGYVVSYQPKDAAILREQLTFIETYHGVLPRPADLARIMPDYLTIKVTIKEKIFQFQHLLNLYIFNYL